MPVRLSTTVLKINSLPNSTNASLLTEFYQYMKNNGSSESHMNNSLKTNMAFAAFIGSGTTFYDIQRKEEIVDFLDTKSIIIIIIITNHYFYFSPNSVLFLILIFYEYLNS
jgi:integrase/recombinase XerD